MHTLQGIFGEQRKSKAMIELAKTEVLRTVAYTLLRQAYGVVEPQRPNVHQHPCFFDEVRQFEIYLIMQALLYSNGNKAGAARLLSLNATTLHSKIKLYSIEMPIEPSLDDENPVTRQVPHVAALTDHRDASFTDLGFAPDLQILKAEVMRSIARVLEFKANNQSWAVDFDGQRGVKFYDEVMKFEIELLTQALAHVGGNQRAAARLLGLKTTTLNSKVKLYKLNMDFIAA